MGHRNSTGWGDPRIGFVYDLFGKGKTVLRGGYGIYYDRIILEAGAEELVQNDRALTVTQYAGSSCTNPNIPAPASLGLCFAPGSTFAAGSPTLSSAFSGPHHQTGGVGILAMGPDAHHPMFQQFSIGVQEQLGSDWLISADGLHVFATRQIIGHLLRDTNSTSQYVSCPGNNAPCALTDPLSGITDNITLLQSQAKSWYDGLIASVQHRPSKLTGNIAEKLSVFWLGIGDWRILYPFQFRLVLGMGIQLGCLLWNRERGNGYQGIIVP
jgi:hypothetical protein